MIVGPFLVLASCGGHAAPVVDAVASDAPVAIGPPLGATPDSDGVTFKVASTRATRIELAVFDAPNAAERRFEMTQQGDVWTTHVATADLPTTIYYGYRVWSPN